MNLCLDDCYDKAFCIFFEDLEADDFCSNLEITLVALRIPHALGINRNGVVAELEVVGGLQRYVNDACRGSEEVSILASSVQGEGSTYSCIYLPAILLVDRVFRIGEGGIFLLRIVAVAVTSENYR